MRRGAWVGPLRTRHAVGSPEATRPDGRRRTAGVPESAGLLSLARMRRSAVRNLLGGERRVLRGLVPDFEPVPAPKRAHREGTARILQGV